MGESEKKSMFNMQSGHTLERCEKGMWKGKVKIYFLNKLLLIDK